MVVVGHILVRAVPPRDGSERYAVKNIERRSRGQRAAPNFTSTRTGSLPGAISLLCGAGGEHRSEDAGAGEISAVESGGKLAAAVFNVSALHREGPNNGCRAARCR